jgi:hypothetical protein
MRLDASVSQLSPRQVAREDENAHPDPLIQGNLVLIVLLGIDGVKSNLVIMQFRANLPRGRNISYEISYAILLIRLLTRSLKASRSCKVNESDFAMIGTTLVTSANFLKTVISI